MLDNTPTVDPQKGALNSLRLLFSIALLFFGYASVNVMLIDHVFHFGQVVNKDANDVL